MWPLLGLTCSSSTIYKALQIDRHFLEVSLSTMRSHENILLANGKRRHASFAAKDSNRNLAAAQDVICADYNHAYSITLYT